MSTFTYLKAEKITLMKNCLLNGETTQTNSKDLGKNDGCFGVPLSF
jgi:hypothetical protein